MRTTQDQMDHDPKDETNPGHGSNAPPLQPQVDSSDEDDDMQLNPEDVVEVIDLDDGDEQAPDDVAEDLGDMDLHHYDIDAQESDEADSGMDAAAASPLRDDAVTIFKKHSGSVFCVSLAGDDDSLAVSGGEDDKGFVWKTGSGEVLFECTGHKDSVTCTSFSHDSTYVVTGDMSGLLKVWKVSTQQEVWTFEVGDLEWLEWHHGAHVILAGTADGDCWMWKIPAGDTRTFQGHGCVCSTGAVLPDGKRLVAGYEDGSVKVWDLKSSSTLQSFSGHTGHQGSIVSLDCHKDGSVVLTGSTDGTAKLLNVANGKLLGTLNCETSAEESENSVEAVGFSKVQNLAATGTLAGVLSVWDIPTQTERYKCLHEAGIVRLKFDSNAPVIYTCTLDGVVHMWDARTGKREAQWFGHEAEILDMRLGRNGSALITGSGDGTSRVFSLQSSDR